MKLRNLFYLLLALPLFAAGCSNDPDVQNVVVLSSTLESDTLSFDTDGGVGVITYALTNAPKDAVVEATCEADWVTKLSVDTNIIFEVLPNDDAARSTEIVVSYENQSFAVKIEQTAQEYVKDVSFTSALRVPLVGLYPDNYIYIIMTDEDAGTQFEAMLIGEENVLTAGVYDDTNCNVVTYVSSLTINDQAINFESYLNSFVVEGDVDNYSIVAKFTDADNNQYRVRFNGVIDGMSEHVNHTPEAGVTMNVTDIFGIYYEQKYSNTFNYNVYLSDTGFEDGNLMAGGKYFSLDLYGIEPVIDEEGYLIVPAGTYTVNANYIDEDWSICSDYTSYLVVNADASGYYTYCTLDSATVVVTENSIYMEATAGDMKHTATYNGEPKFFVGVPEKMEDRDFVADKLYVIYSGVQYADAHNYYVMVSDLGLDPATGASLPGSTFYCFDLYSVEPVIGADGSRYIPYGTYTLDKKNTCAEWTSGRRYSDYTITNADGSEYEVYELFDELTIVVSESGITATGVINGGTHTIVYNGAPKF